MSRSAWAVALSAWRIPGGICLPPCAAAADKKKKHAQETQNEDFHGGPPTGEGISNMLLRNWILPKVFE